MLRDLDIHDVNGDDTKDLYGAGGIYFTVGGGEVETKFDGVLIEGNSLTDVHREGIFMVSTWNRSMSEPESTGTFVPWPNVRITGNTLENMGGDGIVAGNTTGARIDHNVVRGYQQKSEGYNAGIWSYDTDDALFEFNDVSGGETTRDGMSYDVDQGAHGSVFQYNYSHDNEGGFFLICNATGSVKDAVIRYNVSENDHFRGFENCGGEIESASVHNNTIYIGDGVSQTVVNENDPTMRNVEFRNNLVVKEGEGTADFQLQSGGYDLSDNMFWNVDGVPDGAGEIADPLLFSPGEGVDIAHTDGYRAERRFPGARRGGRDRRQRRPRLLRSGRVRDRCAEHRRGQRRRSPRRGGPRRRGRGGGRLRGSGQVRCRGRPGRVRGVQRVRCGGRRGVGRGVRGGRRGRLRRRRRRGRARGGRRRVRRGGRRLRRGRGRRGRRPHADGRISRGASGASRRDAPPRWGRALRPAPTRSVPRGLSRHARRAGPAACAAGPAALRRS
ncbi:hypothetical protein [Microbacterium sp. gxy059]|uniref:hypothetical protein n=1 Tax=Microbacterium sp. gxy059 TaxID=2957199 RepID=UPI003D97F331